MYLNTNRTSKVSVTVIRMYEYFTIRYMFWTDWIAGSPGIYRANLDGSNATMLFTKPTVEWPNGITVDFIAERIYWVDAREDYIASSDFFGKGFKKVIEQSVRFALS